MSTANQEFWDGQAASYDSLYTSAWWQLEDSRIKEWLSRLRLPDNPVVLDIGCGTGFVLRQLDDIGIKSRYVGVDISAKMLANFHSEDTIAVSVELIQADIADYAWTEPTAPDLIASVYCPLSFSADRWTVIRRLAAQQRPGSKLFIMLLNRYSLRRLLRLQIGPRGRYGPRVRFDPEGVGGTTSQGHARHAVDVYYDRPAQLSDNLTEIGYRAVFVGGDGPLSGVLENEKLWRLNEWLGTRTPILSYSVLLVAEKCLCR